MAPGILTNGWHDRESTKSTPKSHTFPHDSLKFDSKLQPKKYEIAGTSSDSKILFLDVNIIESTGKDCYRGDVYIEGERIVSVGDIPDVEQLLKSPDVKTIDGKGRTLMSGMGDAHTHLTWNNNALDLLGNVGVEEHVLITAKSALCYLNSGYTMCYGAASAKDRLDSVVRDAINRGELPGPRCLANGREIARRDGELAAGITAFADGPMEMREVIRHHAGVGVDQIKLSMSGEAITETVSAEECFFTDEETAACVDEAHRHGLRVCAHARARDSVIQCVRHGVDVIYHASYTDATGMDMLVKNKHKHVVAPAINWLYATVHEAEPFGYSFEKAEQVGYKKELEVATTALREMHQRGVTVLPGGDYGFAWCPHGTYARDLEHFVKLLGFTPMESIIAATAGVAKLFMQEHELGKIQPGFYADCVLVNGNPLEDIAVLQDHDKLDVIMINGRIHKASASNFRKHEPQEQPAQDTANNFVVFEDELGRSQVGHLDLRYSTIHSLAMSSGAPLHNLHDVIAVGNDIVRTKESRSLSSVKLLPPIGDRDVLCIGKNYSEHVEEWNNSGYERNATKDDDASFPTVFTKRSSSIIASGDEIYSFANYTEALDYEGEIGVIIGKTGFDIPEDEAAEHIWGYTIINDVTARDRQRDHGQFLMGKSPDTFCPMGPVAVPASSLPATLRVQTFVNGEKRQDGTTEQLITPIPKLIHLISQGLTLQAGDVIATGTPAGVGVGMKPPKFLRAGDLVEISVSGLGKLSNRVSDTKPKTLPLRSNRNNTQINFDRSWNGVGLTKVGNDDGDSKWMNVRDIGSGTETLVFIHGLGASLEYFTPLIESTGLHDRYRIISYDLDGHGLTPTQPATTTTLDSYATDLHHLLTQKQISKATLIGWSLGGLIALRFTETHASSVSKLVLLGPGPTPFPTPAVDTFSKRAALVRKRGMDASDVARTVAVAATSPTTQARRPVQLSAVRQSLLATHPEGYAKGCVALARSRDTVIKVEDIKVPTLIVTGRDDKISPVTLAESYAKKMPDVKVVVVEDVGHWHVTEDVAAVASALEGFL